MINTLYLPELREMLSQNDAAAMAEFCTALHPARTADFMEALSSDELWTVLMHADLATRVEIFSFFEHSKQIETIESQDRDQVADVIAEMAPDDRVDMLADVQEDVVQDLLTRIPAVERRDIERLRTYPEGSAGGVMTTEVAMLHENLTVGEAFDALRKQSEDLETIYYIYVVDEKNHLRGLVSARQMVSKMGKPTLKLGELMESELVVVNVMDDQEEVAHKVAKFDLLAIPVVDDEHRMLGIITHDDVIDVVREEATEDAHRIAAVDPLGGSYLQTHLFTLSWKRGMWLTILFFAALLTAFALSRYEERLRHPQLSWLVVFIPLVISSGGNSGSQSATLIITALSSGDITLADWGRVVWREFLMGLALGGFLGAIGFAVAAFMAPSVLFGLVIPLTLLLVVMCGTLAGSLLPLLFKKLGWDPALMSNPFVAGIIDIVGILIYMNVGLLFLRLTSAE